MSRQSQIHVFLGAPIISESSESIEESFAPASDGDIWKETHLFYDKSAFSLKTVNCGQAEIKKGYAQTGISDHHSPSRMDTRNSASSIASAISRETTCSNTHFNKETGQMLPKSNLKGQDCCFANQSDISEKMAVESNDTISERVSTTENVSSEPGSNGQEHNSPLNHNHLRESLSQYLEDSFPTRQGRQSSNDATGLHLSTQAEFLSIITASHVAVQEKRQFICQNVLEELTLEKETKTKETFEICPLSEPSQDGRLSNVVEYDPTNGSGSSLDLFSPAVIDTIVSSRLLQSHKETDDHEYTDSKSFSPVAEELESKAHDLPTSLAVVSSKRSYGEEHITVLPNTSLEGRQASKKAKRLGSPIKLDFRKDPDKTSIFGHPSARTVLLKNCFCKSQRYNILVVVVLPCHLKEVPVKSGLMSGSKVPLSTIVVLDQSEVERKVVLWRSAAFWTLAVFPGDIILITDVMLYEDSWNGEMILQSTTGSGLLNLGSCSGLRPNEYSHMVNIETLQGLLAHLSLKHKYLTNMPSRKPQNLDCIKHVRYDQLQPDMLVHLLLKVIGITIVTESLYHYKGQTQKKVVLTVEQVKGHHGRLVLWGAATLWHAQIKRKKDHIWDFRNVFSRRNCTTGDLELHTTPWSASECLFEDDKRALGFRAEFEKDKSAPPNILDIPSVLEGKYSGMVQVKAHISELRFSMGTPHRGSLILDASTPLESILASLPEITYSGCGKCGSELNIDENMVYQQCFRCLPFNKVQLYYRPAVITAFGGEREIEVHVLPEIVEKIFLNIPPDLLTRNIVSSTDVTYGMVVADLCHSLLENPADSYKLKIRTLTELDENSIPLKQDFHLLDFLPDF